MLYVVSVSVIEFCTVCCVCLNKGEICSDRCVVSLIVGVVCLQCRQVKVTILGDEPVPVQVDGEAWMQPPGYIRIVHKNRAMMLTRDRVRHIRPSLQFVSGKTFT